MEIIKKQRIWSLLANIDSSLTSSIDWYDVVNVAVLADISERKNSAHIPIPTTTEPPSEECLSPISPWKQSRKIPSNKAFPELQTISDMRHGCGVNQAIASGLPYKPGRITVSSSQPGENFTQLYCCPAAMMTENRKTFGFIACSSKRRLALGETGCPWSD